MAKYDVFLFILTSMQSSLASLQQLQYTGVDCYEIIEM